jgi:hypothetical protein
MASLDEIEGDVLVAGIFAALALVLYSFWLKGAGGAVANAASSTGSAAVNVVTSAAQGAGNSLGDWIWNGLGSIFPSLADTSANPLNPSPGALQNLQLGKWLSGTYTPPLWYNPPTPAGFPDIPVDPRFGGGQ